MDVTVAVLQPADYAKMGATYVSKPGETLPIYLKNNIVVGITLAVSIQVAPS